MSDSVDSSSRICRAELCELEGVHLRHDITPFHVGCEVCSKPAGELCYLAYVAISGEHGEIREKPHVVGPYHHKRILAARGRRTKPTKSLRDPWVVPCAEALDESILRAASDRVPRMLCDLVPLVQNDYGQIAESEVSAYRQMQRRIKRLCSAGCLLRIEIGDRLFAYLAPDARLASDVDAVRELVMENFDREPKPWSSRALA
jgi:hypothetical protein